jgi:hypothetical protein
MRLWWYAAVLGLATISPAAAGDLALQRVVLSTGGVGYFEYAAQVDGSAQLSLDVPLDQVDDILKSLVVYDPHGTVGELTLPGREPLEQSFTDLPFDRAALASAPALLNALQGAEVRVSGGKPMTGRLLHVTAETARGKDGLAITRHRVSLLTSAGVEQFILEDADSIAFVDPQLQQQVATALSRLAAYRGKGLRHLVLESRSQGSRIVRVGYVVGVPLWKATYRLSLKQGGNADQARLQGWAVLENFSGHAWQGVELTLLSGNPVTFRQSLYESYYVQRPSVPIEVAGRVLPPADTGSMLAAKARGFAGMPAGVPAPAATMRAQAEAAPPPMAPPAPPEPAGIEAAAAAENATDTAFTLPYKVDVGNGQSLVVPILDRAVPASRLDLYQPNVDARHPLAAVALSNDGDTSLPPGVMTLYGLGSDGALYLGDAQLAAFPKGEKRMLSYAVDTRTDIDRTTQEQRLIVNAAISHGVLRLTRRLSQTTIYRIKTANPDTHRLIVEQPRLPGWNLVVPDPAKVELAPNAYRIPAPIAPDKQTALTVTLQRPLEETIRLLDLDQDQLGVYAASTELSANVRKALGEIVRRREALAAQTADLARLQQQRQQLVDDEKRLRANLAAVGHDTALYKQTLDKLGQSEAGIDSLTAAIAKATADLDTARQQLETYVDNLTL